MATEPSTYSKVQRELDKRVEWEVLTMGKDSRIVLATIVANDIWQASEYWLQHF